MNPSVAVRFSPGSLPGHGGPSPDTGQGLRAASSPGPGSPPVIRPSNPPSIAPRPSTPSAGPSISAQTPAAPPPHETQAVSSKIRSFGHSMGEGHHQETWKRPTNVTGAGATHVRSFHCRLAAEAVEYLDKQINEWLDQHPDYEVKFVTTNVGEWTGKLKEPNLIVQVWV